MFRKSEVEGKVVVEASGKALGTAKDIAFGLDGSAVLIVQGKDNSEIEITMDRVAGVGDYVVVRREGAAPPKKPAAVPAPAAQPVPTPAATPNPMIPPARAAAIPVGSGMPNTCKSCGAQLRPGAKFCTKCGTPV